MAKAKVIRPRGKPPVVVVPLEELRKPPAAVAAAVPVADKPAPVAPLIVTPSATAVQYSPAQMFDRPIDSRVTGWYEALVLACLCERANAAGNIEGFWSDQLQQAIGAESYLRYHVNDNAGLWIDSWRFAGGREVLVFPATQTQMQFTGYVSPGMSSVSIRSTTQKAYTGIATQLELYRAWINANWDAARIDRPGAFVTTGHSLGGAVAQFVAIDWNNRFANGVEPATVAPVRQVVTFGSPAVFGEIEDDFVLTRAYRHIRYVNVGDDVPNLTQNAIKAYHGTVVANIVKVLEGGIPVPRHYDTASYCVVPDVSAEVQQLQNQRAVLLANRGNSRVTGNYPLFWTPDEVRLFQQETRLQNAADVPGHGVGVYCDKLEHCARTTGNAPYPDFTNLLNARAIGKIANIIPG